MKINCEPNKKIIDSPADIENRTIRQDNKLYLTEKHFLINMEFNELELKTSDELYISATVYFTIIEGEKGNFLQEFSSGALKT